MCRNWPGDSVIRIPVQVKVSKKYKQVARYTIIHRLPFQISGLHEKTKRGKAKKIYYTGHEVKSFKEDNIPLRNNKCNLYRTRGRIPAKNNASRHAKG